MLPLLMAGSLHLRLGTSSGRCAGESALLPRWLSCWSGRPLLPAAAPSLLMTGERDPPLGGAPAGVADFVRSTCRTL